MSTAYIIDHETGTTYITLSSAQAGTFHTASIKLDVKAAIAEANNVMRDALLRFYPAFTPKKTDDEDNDEEQEWDTLFAQPHVQDALCRLAEEAERQFVAGETEEGGFAVE